MRRRRATSPRRTPRRAAVGETEPFAPSFEGWAGPWRFAAPQETEVLLREAGFAEARCWLEQRPVTPEDPFTYLREINLGAHLERLPQELRDPFVRAVLERHEQPVTLEYVRLNMDATA